MSPTGQRWLDRLARRAAGHERGTAPVRIVDSGLSRRTALRAAGATVLAAGTLRGLTAPPFARAETRAECEAYHNNFNYQLFLSCGDKATHLYDQYGKAISHAQKALKTAKTQEQRDQLKLIIKQARNGQHQAIQKLEDCNQEYAHNRSRDLQDCKDKDPPPPTGGGGGGGGGGGTGSSGCPQGTHMCAKQGDFTECCYGGDTCCGCDGGLVCCIYSDCRCCG
jgi:hypothetical protein